MVQASPALPRGLSHEGLAGRLYLGPAGTLAGSAGAAAIASGRGWGLAGGPLVFALCSLWLRDGDRVFQSVAPFPEMLEWSEAEGEAVAEHVARLLRATAANRPHFAGLALDRPRVMGIVNVTPDSFSDGGRFFAAEDAVAHGVALLEAGADILDVGGESTRPGSAAVSPEEEMCRVLPVVRALAEKGAVVSVDTRHSAVMGAAVEAGAAIINDISALTGDAEALRVAAASGAAIVLMHMAGEPRTMQASPSYRCAPLDVYDYLEGRLAACRAAGIAADRLCVDPGIGFGKTLEHNLQIMVSLGLYHSLGVPLLLGVSRKSFIGKMSGDAPADRRLPGSVAAALAGVDQGIQILRVHDVAETVQAITVWQGCRAPLPVGSRR